MSPLRLPDSSDDELSDDDLLGSEDLSPLDVAALQRLGLDDLPELDLEEFGSTLRAPAEPLTPPPGAATYSASDGTVFWFVHGMAGDALPIQITVMTPEDSAGYARMGCFEEGVLTLADVRLDPSYRGRGMGSALLRHIIDLAREHSLHRIYGVVVEHDYQAMPYLLDWYARHGFTVTSATNEDRAQPHQGNAVALLDLELSAERESTKKSGGMPPTTARY